VLSRELKELVERRLIVRKDYAQVPPKVEYSLTRLGASLMPTLAEIVQWGIACHHEKINGMFPLFRCTRMLMAGGADTPSSWR
jgi:DNA-binding HxlR family transcriptional regulator